MVDYRGLSLWLDSLPGPLDPRPGLPGSDAVDVAVVGAGFTGLWTAYSLLRADPSLRVVVLEAQIAGFGASGRNGGWCSALFPVAAGRLAAEHGHDAAVAQYAAMRGAVRDVVRTAADEGIEADIAVGGTVVAARSEAQLRRASAEVADEAPFGVDLALLSAPDARARLRATGVVGGTYTPDCAAINPAKLVRGLAEAVERLGGRIYERTAAVQIRPGAVITDHGRLRADVVVRATEGFTSDLPDLHRASVPVYSLMIATEPLPRSVWDEIGLAHRETWSDFRNLIIYGQRTADGRMAFGGRGAPYHFASRIRPSFDRKASVFAGLHKTLIELFPILQDVGITHRWGGPLGITRDWHASVGLDRTTGLAWAGGYVGDGVSTTNLAGRTLADLILRRDTGLTRLPWVGHRSPTWEPEPLRWLGANAALRAMTWADRAEQRGDRPSRLAGAVNQVLSR